MGGPHHKTQELTRFPILNIFISWCVNNSVFYSALNTYKYKDNYCKTFKYQVFKTYDIYHEEKGISYRQTLCSVWK